MNSLPRDRTAAFFAAATDPERMRAVMAQHLRAPDGPPVEVVACTVEFTRRSGSRSVIEYLLTLRDPASGSEWTQVVGGVIYGGAERTRIAWARLRRQHAALPTPATALVRAAYVPELDVLLQVFPFDHQLPALEPLLAGPLPGLLAPLLAQFGPGAWQLVEWEAESMRYRVDLRAALRLTVQAREAGTGAGAARRFFAKIYGLLEQAERAWGVQRDVGAALAAEDAPFAIAPLVAYLPDDRVLVQGEVQGISLLEVLQNAAADEEAIHAVRRTARALAALHQLPVAGPPHRVELGRTDPQRLRRNTERLRTARPDLASLVDEVEASILTRLAALDELPPIPIHGDLKPAHVVFNGERVVLLDLDKFAAGEPMFDVTHLLFHLRRGGSAVTRAFVEEYFGQVPAAWEPRLAPHYARALLAEASNFSKSDRQTPGESASDRAQQDNRINVLLREAHAGVADRTWWSDPESSPWSRASERRAARRGRREEQRVRRSENRRRAPVAS